MSWQPSSEIELDDGDELKYWRFIGEDWLWFKLNDEQVKWIEVAGKRRDSFGKTKTKVDFSKGDSKPLHISGIAAELTASYFTNEKINQIELKSKSIADLGNDIEVKSTRYSKNWVMYVNESQLNKTRRYIFAITFLYPKYVALVGWCYGRQFPSELEVLQWRKGERAYKISWQALNHMNTFERKQNASI